MTTRDVEVATTDPGRNVEVVASDPRAVVRTSPDGPRVVITEGGAPPDDVLAAIAVALLAQHPPPSPANGRLPAWTRAALAEGVGGPIAVAPGDLDAAVGGLVAVAPADLDAAVGGG